jgi:hypothetical protein
MSTRRTLLATGLASVLVLSGCTDFFELESMVQPGVPTGTVTVVNQSARPMVDVRATRNLDRFGRPAGLYSDNLMAAGQVVPPGGSFTFAASQGVYSLRAATGGGGIFGVVTEHFGSASVRAGANSTWIVR